MRKSDVVRLRVEDTEKEAFEEASRLAGTSFSTWARLKLRQAAIEQFENAGRRIDFFKPKEVLNG